MTKFRISGHVKDTLVALSPGNTLVLNGEYEITVNDQGHLMINSPDSDSQVAVGQHIAQAGRGGYASVTVNGKKSESGEQFTPQGARFEQQWER